MLREQCQVGMQVIFGRERGEKTLGKVIKMNPKTAKVETLEDRGSKYPAGSVWGVPYSMMSPASGEALPESREPLKYSPFQDPAEICIMEAISCVYTALSPENLSADGELPRYAVEQKRRRYNAMLRGLETALGRKVSEMESYEWEQSRREYKQVVS